MKRIACLLFMGLMALSVVLLAAPNAAADHQDWFARGDFNGWDLSNPMVHQAGDYYTGTITGLTPGDGYNYKIALEDWSITAPSSDGRVAADASGEINFHFWETDVWADGWEPSGKVRVGYDDHDQFDWAVIGSFDGWANDLLVLTDQGAGQHTGEIALAAGSYDWKFRQEGSWDYNMGDDFGGGASNNSITVANNGDIWAFEIDLPGGRWRAYSVVPEPASIVLLGIAGIALVGAARRRK